MLRDGSIRGIDCSADGFSSDTFLIEPIKTENGTAEIQGPHGEIITQPERHPTFCLTEPRHQASVPRFKLSYHQFLQLGKFKALAALNRYFQFSLLDSL